MNHGKIHFTKTKSTRNIAEAEEKGSSLTQSSHYGQHSKSMESGREMK